MESAPKTVSLPAAPLGYVYARRADSLPLDELAMLSARSADSELAVMPVIRGLTVEQAFATNVAVVAGSKTTGLGGSGTTFKLSPSHYHPNAFVFHGGAAIRASSGAPNLSRACDAARKRFGFSAYATAPVDNAVETTGASICEAVGLNPTAAVLYLVVTETFKETVYMCNAFLHYGGAGTVSVGPHDVVRIPLYPVQLFMPDVNRLAGEPFNAKHRSIGDEFVYPRPFFNSDLCRLLHGYVLGPAAVSLRVRNLDGVARGAAHLALDENHEGSVLPPDVTFTLFDSAQTAGRGGGRGPQRGGDGTSAKSTPASGTERRLASVMAADTALSMDSLVGAGVYDAELPSVEEWPLLASSDGRERLEALGAYVSRVSGLVGAMVFSSNSVLYMTEVDDGGPAEGKDGSNPSYHRFYLIAAPHVAGNPQTDKDGRVLPHTADQHSAPISGANQEFSLDYLALACGFCPQILARVLFYLERCDSGAFGGRNETDALRYLAGTLESEVPCGLCDRTTRPACAHTTLHRLRQRLPKFGAPARLPIGVFGTMNSAYSDCDVLGNYASYGALKKPNDNEAPKSIMQDTYRAAVERLFADLEQARLVERESVTQAGVGPGAAGLVHDHASFRGMLATIKETVEQAADQFVRTLVESRDFKIREALADANHTMSISLDPYSSSFCPVTSFLSRRTNLAVLQDLVLSQCHCLFYGQAVEGRNFRSQFQPVLRRRFLDMLNGGFLTAKTVTVTVAESGVVAPDLTLPATEPPTKECDGDLARVSMEVMRDLRVKNRVLFSNGGANLSEAAKARVAGMASAYRRPEKAANILSGAVGFLVKQFHAVLFPKGHPPGIETPNPQWFWTLLQRNQMPARLLGREDVETITAVKRFSDEYAAINFINLTPNNVGELAQFYFANLVLKYCDHSQYFINGLTAIVVGSKRPRDPASVLAWIDRPLAGQADVEPAAHEVLRGLDSRPALWTGTFLATHMVRSVMEQRPMVVMGLSISKYNGSAGNNRVFQAGNWNGLNGGKNVCPLMAFDRTRRFVLACPRVGFTCEAGGFGAGVRENTLSEQVRGIVAEGGPLVQTAVFLAVLHALGPRTQHLAVDDWVGLVEDEFLAVSLDAINAKVTESFGEWTVEAAQELARDLEAQTSAGTAAPDDGAFDFGACAGDDALAAGPGFGLAQAAAAPSSGVGGAGQKRPHPEDILFDMGGVPEKKPSLTFDML
ncbi:single-stranded DNA-binding protein [Equid alphaherpesvirus 3]|uniref:Single-stranded DNA-binding protein n=1 Tax=Equid alphaherpesvirus 3 TaxID=80341 RepID=A0A077BCK8_9ALPH|nr:single-stranded DNA-binding protein [Equid alphaherpesvirus 3]AIL02948.1 single-stranded DNA-binding protein [Equid alphaherpesvirus 3]